MGKGQPGLHFTGLENGRGQCSAVGKHQEGRVGVWRSNRLDQNWGTRYRLRVLRKGGCQSEERKNLRLGRDEGEWRKELGL